MLTFLLKKVQRSILGCLREKKLKSNLVRVVALVLESKGLYLLERKRLLRRLVQSQL